MPPNTTPSQDDEVLAAVRALQRGAGPDAFAPIYRHYYRPLFNFFANRPALREEADDLAQDTLLRAYERIEQYRFEAPFTAWIRQIGENVWKNSVREWAAAKRGRLLQVQEPALAQSGESPAALSLCDVVSDGAANPEEVLLADERTRVLQRAIESLPPGMRQCLELRLFADLKYREIADVTGIGLNSVRSQLFEARQRLKPVLDEYFQGTDL